MTRVEFQDLLRKMKSIYPQPTFIPDEEAMQLWYELLQDLPFEQVSKAVRKHMLTSKFPPSVSEIREFVREDNTIGEMTPLDAWALVERAIRNGIYGAEEEFNKLPDTVQRAVGRPEILKEWALLDAATVQSVEQSHFIRAYRTECERANRNNTMPDAIGRLMQETAERLNG